MADQTTAPTSKAGAPPASDLVDARPGAHPALDALVRDDWVLLVCNQRYGAGVTALLGRTFFDVAWVEGCLTGGDNEAFSMQMYLADLAGDRFPVSGVWEPSLDAALASLEAVLQRVPAMELDAWKSHVIAAYNDLKDAQSKYGDIAFAEAALKVGELHRVD